MAGQQRQSGATKVRILFMVAPGAPAGQHLHPAAAHLVQLQEEGANELGMLALELAADGVAVKKALKTVEQFEGGGHIGALLKALRGVEGGRTRTGRWVAASNQVCAGPTAAKHNAVIPSAAPSAHLDDERCQPAVQVLHSPLGLAIVLREP